MKDNSIKEIEKRNELLGEIEWKLIDDFIQTRKNHGLSQQKMADQCNAIRETIARIENRTMKPTITTMIDLLEPLGLTLKIEKIDK